MILALTLGATALSACSATSDSRDGANDPVPPYPATRDPLTWPYPADSIWNHPRGDDADLVPAPVTTGADGAPTVTAEEDLIIADPQAPGQDVYRTTAGWDDSKTRCGASTDDVLVSDLPIPTGWSTDPGYDGATPNQATAVVLADDTLLETQPLHVCSDGTVVSQYASDSWRGSSIRTGGVPGDLGAGAHGGSGMTAFGGTIRLGEWVPGGAIRHALKFTLDGSELSTAGDGMRWPANRADAAYRTAYTGSNELVRMGSLLTLPPDFDVDALQTQPARILARALRDYGSYVVDNAGRPTVGVATEWGPDGRVTDEFEDSWGYPLHGRIDEAEGDQRDFLEDIDRMWAAVAVVDDNGPDSVGGAGEPMTRFAPPLEGGR